MKLTNPSNDELDAAFAERVCGYFRNPIFKEKHSWCRKSKTGEIVVLDGLGALPPFSASTDAVLPFLEKRARAITISYCDVTVQWTVNIIGFQTTWIASSETLPRAIVIALLRANGVEVEVT